MKPINSMQKIGITKHWQLKNIDDTVSVFANSYFRCTSLWQ